MAQLLKIACIQLDCEPDNIKLNMEKSLGFIAKAKEQGADIVVLPELFNVGYDLALLKSINYQHQESNFQQSVSYLLATAQQFKIHIVAGLLEAENGKLHNGVFVFSEKGILTKYRKLALFSLSGEPELFEPGNQTATFMFDQFKFGIMICFDIRFSDISQKYLKDNCSCLVISSAFPFPRLDHWKTLLKCRAIENQLYIAAANRVGIDNGSFFLGNSCIIDPWGTVRATANETEETVIVYEIDIERVNEIRKSIPIRESFEHIQALLKPNH